MSRAHAQSGFTLIEMLVALTIFSLAALALLRLQGIEARGTAALDRSVFAQAVARTVAYDVLVGARAPALGDASGAQSNGGRNWRWTQHVAPLGDGGFLRIDVVVSDAAGTSLARLSVVRRAGELG